MTIVNVHIAVIGNGRIGRPTAYSILNERLADEISLVDLKPDLAWAFGEELRHASASLKYDVKINTYDVDEAVTDADVIVVCIGKPRLPGEKISRRDLVGQNAEIICHLARCMTPCNPKAKWVVVTNPVDAMATLFKRLTGLDYVIGTGDHADTLRLRTKLAMDLDVPVSKVEGFVGGEHGSAAHVLWSTVKIEGVPIDEYLEDSRKELDREDVTNYVRGVSERILNAIGATEYGPAAGFRDIIRSIVQNRGEIYSVAVSRKFSEIPESVNVNVPIHVGQHLGPSIWDDLTGDEQENIIDAARAIYDNYRVGLDAVEGKQDV